MGMKPRLKKVPCKECEGTGQVSKHWAAGGGRIGYRSWLEICPSCRRRALLHLDMEEGIKQFFALTKTIQAPEEFRYEVVGEVWDPKRKRYFSKDKPQLTKQEARDFFKARPKQ